MLERAKRSNAKRSPDAVAVDGGAFQGFIDRIDAARGVEGWCVNIKNPSVPVELELLVNGLAFERTLAHWPRPQIAESLGLPQAIGFAFEASALDRLLSSRKSLEVGALAIRVANSSLLLRCADGAGAWETWLEARAALLEAEEEPAALQILRTLQDDAKPLLAFPGGVAGATEAGVMEMAAPGAGGIVWFTGWVRREWVGDLAAIVVDRRKFVAGVTMTPYERDDLPAEAVGVVGALLSNWSPSRQSEAVIKLGLDAGAFLRVLRPLRISGLRDILSHLPAAARHLAVLADATDGWEAGAERAGGAKAAVDAAAGLEGFGVFMKGWIVSPSRAVKSLSLRLGDRLFPCNPSSLHFTPRPDLKSAFPQGRDALNRAGFCCIFECDAPSSDYEDPGLKVTYDDGRNSYHETPDLAIAKILPNGDGGPFREFYPGFERQPLFAPYALAYSRAFSERFGALSADAVECAPTQIIFTAPNERHLLYRLFDDLGRRLHGAQGPLPGVTVLASESARHGEIHYLFEDFRLAFAGASTLIFVPDASHALWALDAALVLLAARRFVFVGPDVALSEAGWRAAFVALSAEPSLLFLAIDDPVEPWIAPETSLRAFAWTSEAYLKWRRERRLPIAAAPSAQLFGPAASVEPSCAVRTGRRTADAAVRRIDELLSGES